MPSCQFPLWPHGHRAEVNGPFCTEKVEPNSSGVPYCYKHYRKCYYARGEKIVKTPTTTEKEVAVVEPEKLKAPFQPKTEKVIVKKEPAVAVKKKPLVVLEVD